MLMQVKGDRWWLQTSRYELEDGELGLFWLLLPAGSKVRRVGATGAVVEQYDVQPMPRSLIGAMQLVWFYARKPAGTGIDWAVVFIEYDEPRELERCDKR